jgi:Family of unknown function (DUF6492)
MQVTAVEKPLDIVIKTRALDLIPFLQLQADLARHSRLKGRVYVVVPREELDRFAGVVAKGTVLMAAEEVTAAAGYAEAFPDTWLTQQIIKLIAANIVEHEHYLILDSNTLIGFDFNERHFLSHGEYVYAVNEFRDVAWELQSRNFLGLRAQTCLLGFRAANQIFSKQNAQALMRHVEQLYNDNIVRVLLRYSDDLSTIYWTEFALYGVFVQSLQNGSGHCFEQRSDLIHYSARQKFSDLLEQIEAEAPLMVKFRKRRRGQYDLGPEGYARRVAEIKRAYQQGFAARGAR